MAGVSKLSPTDPLSREVPNLPSTPLWCHLYLGTVSRPLCRSRRPGHQACERTPELLQARRCRLLVLAIEVGGCWSQEAFLRLLAQAKTRTIPAQLKASFTNALIHRWSAHKPFMLPACWNLTASRARSQTEPTSHLRCWPRPPPTSRQPRSSPRLRSSGLELVWSPCAFGAAFA